MRTYVVRVQEPRPDDGGTESLHGVAEEIATGRQVCFSSGAQLLEMLVPSETSTATPDASTD